METSEKNSKPRKKKALYDSADELESDYEEEEYNKVGLL